MTELAVLEDRIRRIAIAYYTHQTVPPDYVPDGKAKP